MHQGDGDPSMQPLLPSASEVDALRSIVRAGFAHEKTKAICARAGWKVCTDEPELGYTQFYLDFGGRRKDRRLLSVMNSEGEVSPFAFVPLYYFGEDEGDPAELPREPFDKAFEKVRAGLEDHLAQPHRTGTYSYKHRGKKWPYNYACWQLDDASLVLLQDEYDIQFGMDLSLWLFPARTKVKFPLHN
jgi:hypothetical protein